MYLLFDDDCGICTQFAGFFSRLLKIPHIPLHNPSSMKKGIPLIGEETYWKSFHIVNGNIWVSEKEAIIALSSNFPFGNILSRIVALPPIITLCMIILRKMQIKRKLSCAIQE